MSAPIRDLRNLIALQIGSSGHPDHEYHLRKIMETNEATREWLRRTMENAEEIDFVTEEGIVIGNGIRAEFNKERARLALANIVRGLYLIETGKPLPSGTPVSVIEVDPRIVQALIQRLIRYDHQPPTRKGNDIAMWVPYLTIQGESEDTTAWLLLFMGSVCFLGGTGSVAASLERLWQQMLNETVELPEKDGKRQMKVPKLSDGTYWIPPVE